MVSTRRSRKASQSDLNESVPDCGTAATKSPQKSPTRQSTRRTRSNSRSEHEEATIQDETVSQKLPSKQSKKTSRRRGSSVDKDEKINKSSSVELGVPQEQGTATSDSLAHSQSHSADKEQQSSLVNVATKPAAESAAARRPNETSEITTESKGDDSTSENELTKLIPGYVAPHKLDTSSLDSYRPSGGLSDLTRRAQQTDASTAGFVVSAAESQAQVMKKSSNGCMPTTYTSLYSSFKYGAKRAPDHSAGAGWFGMQPTPMTDELKTDLAVIRNRNYLDPKRFYKSADANKNKVMQMGTVIEGSAEFYSSRLTKKQRRTNLTEEIMADPEAADYTKRKYKSMQQEKSAKGQRRSRNKMSKRSRRGY